MFCPWKTFFLQRRTTYHQCKLQSRLFPSGSWNHSTGRRLGRLSVHVREIKTSRVAASSVSGNVSGFFFSHRLCWHMQHQKGNKDTLKGSIIHSLNAFLPSPWASVFLSFLFFLWEVEEVGWCCCCWSLRKQKTLEERDWRKRRRKRGSAEGRLFIIIFWPPQVDGATVSFHHGQPCRSVWLMSRSGTTSVFWMRNMTTIC